MVHFLWPSHNVWNLLFVIWTWKTAFIQIGKKSYNFIRQEEMSVAVSASILQQGVCQNFIHFSFLFVNLKSNINVSKSKHDLTRRSSYSGSSEGVKIWGCQYYSVGIICPLGWSRVTDLLVNKMPILENRSYLLDMLT